MYQQVTEGQKVGGESRAGRAKGRGSVSKRPQKGQNEQNNPQNNPKSIKNPSEPLDKTHPRAMDFFCTGSSG